MGPARWTRRARATQRCCEPLAAARNREWIAPPARALDPASAMKYPLNTTKFWRSHFEPRRGGERDAIDSRPPSQLTSSCLCRRAPTAARPSSSRARSSSLPASWSNHGNLAAQSALGHAERHSMRRCHRIARREVRVMDESDAVGHQNAASRPGTPRSRLPRRGPASKADPRHPIEASMIIVSERPVVDVELRVRDVREPLLARIDAPDRQDPPTVPVTAPQQVFGPTSVAGGDLEDRGAGSSHRNRGLKVECH